jgi:Flp pilus assembly pilin Flp
MNDTDPRPVAPQDDGESGQAMVEYGIISVALFGGLVLSWPFTVQLFNALDGYYQAIYWVIQSPIP